MIALEKTLTDFGIVLIEENGWVGVKVKDTHGSTAKNRS